MIFKRKKDEVMNAIDKINEAIKKEEPSKPVEEWIWIDGYKGTDKDMKCRDYQYELQKCFDISDDKEVEMCEHGFHLCKELNDVFKYYTIGGNNRFFEVKALVRKKDYETYRCGCSYYFDKYGNMHATYSKNKLVAKSIIFTRELSVDEIVNSMFDVKDWAEEDKLKILEIGYDNALHIVRTRKLIEVGYSETFAKVIANTKKFDIAYAVGTQEGLSMDMKVWAIYNN